MLHIRDRDQAIETWRDGVTTRMYVSSATGSGQLTVFEQWCAPGHGAPLHVHAVEEVLRVLDGQAQIESGGNRALVSPGESVIIPAGIEHGFVNSGDGTLHTMAILAAPIFEASYATSNEVTGRWGPVVVSPDDRNLTTID